MVAGAILETVYRVLHLPGEPRMTRFVAKEMSTAHWFDLAAAKKDFGYQPEVSIDEGMTRLQQRLQRET
jgi:nucleoside-diphosphate-sugar epimerase